MFKPSIDNLVSYLNGSNKEFLSDKYYATRLSDGRILKGKDNTIKFFNELRKDIKDIRVEEEDSHYYLFYKTDKEYISKIKVDENGIISIVIEEFNDKKIIQMYVSYDGSCFSGAQRLPNERTVQSELENALNKMLKRNVDVTIASRTDKGVHAYKQSISFESFGIDKDKFMYSLNLILPGDIKIVEANYKRQLFDARYDVVSKTYEYVIDRSNIDVFKSKYVLFEDVKDINRLREELKSIEGTHDFKSFEKGDKGDSIRTIYKTEVIEEGSLIKIRFTGNGFLHNMIRFIVGSVLNILKTNEGSLKDILDSKSKNNTPYLVSGAGLYLVDIKY